VWGPTSILPGGAHPLPPSGRHPRLPRPPRRRRRRHTSPPQERISRCRVGPTPIHPPPRGAHPLPSELRSLDRSAPPPPLPSLSPIPRRPIQSPKYSKFPATTTTLASSELRAHDSRERRQWGRRGRRGSTASGESAAGRRGWGEGKRAAAAAGWAARRVWGFGSGAGRSTGAGLWWKRVRVSCSPAAADAGEETG
jgi:hypothetical protein